MEIFKFLYKKQKSKAHILPIVLAMLGSIILFSTLDLHVNRYVIALICSIASYIGIRRFISKASEGIEEVQVNEDSFKLYFFNKMKDALTAKKSETLISVDDETIGFSDKGTGKHIGTAYKKSIEEPEKWPRLLELVSS